MNNFDSHFFELEDDTMMKFHSNEYVDLLKNIDECNFEVYRDHCTRFGFSADCPCPTDSKFYDLCDLYTKGMKAIRFKREPLEAWGTQKKNFRIFF